MNFLPDHLTPQEAISLQKALAEWIIETPLPPPQKGLLVGGADCSCGMFSQQGFAVIVVLKFPDLTLVDTSWVQGTLSFPYIPGLLSFRELPLLHQAWHQLRHHPDLVVLDGQGYAHPRRIGLACHAGLLWDVPTIGCGKSLLIGAVASLGESKGSTAPIIHRDEQIGIALRTRSKVKPVYVSRGHLSDLSSSVEWILRLCGKYRQPEVIRQAHRTVNEIRITKKSRSRGCDDRLKS